MTWTAERVAQLKNLIHAGGLSHRQIANRLGGGLTRNAVIGKAHRMGLPRLPRFSTRGKEKRRPPLHGRRPHYRGPDNVPAQIPLPLEEPKGPAPSRRMTILSLREDGKIEANPDFHNRSCRWPREAHPILGWEFCGHETVAGRPYCRHHLEMSRDLRPMAGRLMLPEPGRDSIPRAATYSRILDPEAA